VSNFLGCIELVRLNETGIRIPFLHLFAALWASRGALPTWGARAHHPSPAFHFELELWKCLHPLAPWAPVLISILQRRHTVAFFIFLRLSNPSKLYFLPLIMSRTIKPKRGSRGGGGTVALMAYGAALVITFSWQTDVCTTCSASCWTSLTPFCSCLWTWNEKSLFRVQSCVSVCGVFLFFFFSRFQFSVSPEWEWNTLNVWSVRNEARGRVPSGYCKVARCEISLIFCIVLFINFLKFLQ
jgi:hypothetical protein